MDDRDQMLRERSLRTAVGRLSEARSLRAGDMPTLVHPYDITPEVEEGRRTGLLRFADRARRASARFEQTGDDS